MNKFELVNRFKDSQIDLIPTRKTSKSAGYDMYVAEDTVIPAYWELFESLQNQDMVHFPSLNDIAKVTKASKCKPTLVSTGVKCQMDDGIYLELSVRSSTPLKYWLILANGVGIIDGDYYNNSDNEGEIFFQLINLSPWPIYLKAGDCIGQAIFKQYDLTDNDFNDKVRTGGFGSTDDIENVFDAFFTKKS